MTNDIITPPECPDATRDRFWRDWIALWNGAYELAPKIIAPEFRIHAAIIDAEGLADAVGADRLVRWISQSASAFRDAQGKNEYRSSPVETTLSLKVRFRPPRTTGPQTPLAQIPALVNQNSSNHRGLCYRGLPSSAPFNCRSQVEDAGRSLGRAFARASGTPRIKRLVVVAAPASRFPCARS